MEARPIVLYPSVEVGGTGRLRVPARFIATLPVFAVCGEIVGSDSVNRVMSASIGPKLNAIEERIVEMYRLGIDVRAISPSPGQYFYFADPDLGRESSRLINDGIAETRRCVKEN